MKIFKARFFCCSPYDSRPMSGAKRRGDNTRQGDAEEDAQPAAKRPRMGGDPGPGPQPAASVREPSAEVLIDAVVEIAEQNSWRRLAGEFRLVALSAEVLRAILGLAEDDAAELALSLKDLRIKTVGTLLDACEEIAVKADGSVKAIGELVSVDPFFLRRLKNLRDKVAGMSISASPWARLAHRSFYRANLAYLLPLWVFQNRSSEFGQPAPHLR
jgi:hypothetical protein